MGKSRQNAYLGEFTGIPGVKQIPSDSTHDMLCQETDRYYHQHREKYDRSYKVLKWVDVTSAEKKKFQ
jgi:hypothetical protein